MSAPAEAARGGLAYGIIAYSLWGAVPLFWKLLEEVPATESIAHRAVWGSIAFLVMARAAGAWGELGRALRNPRAVAAMGLSAALIAVNWGTFVYAVDTDRVLEVSLGYFINPLITVALGTVVLGETLRRAQWLAIALAAAGVALLAVHADHGPWLALVLAMTFAAYGLVRKTAPVSSLAGSVGSSRVDLQACKLEYSIVSPK